MRRSGPIAVAAAVVLMLLVEPRTGGTAIVANDTLDIELGHRLQSPAAQVGVDSTTSAVQTTMVWPSGSNNRLEFDWSVDSEAGWDFLRVTIDGSLAYQWSGVNRKGHVSHAVTAGSHVIRFEYAKDGSLSHGRDRAWIDNLGVVSDGRVLEIHSFDHRNPSMADWTASGYGGGMQPAAGELPRVLARPITQAFTGYISSPTTSWAERTLTWPAGTDLRVVFDYLVDSEANYDFFRVLVDGAVAWSKSGLATGTESIPVTAGTHTIRFEYYKDTSVDVGRDTAELGEVYATANGAILAWDDFDGTTPIGGAPSRWSTGGTFGGWVLTEPPAPAAWLKKEAPSSAPEVDGHIRLAVNYPEYAEATAAPLYDVGASAGAAGSLFLRASASEHALYLAARVHSATTAVGGEAGELVVLANADRLAANMNLVCGRFPSSLDRKIVIGYSSASGVRTATATSTQYWGSCQGTWNLVSSDADKWPLTIAIAEPASDPGYVHIEAKLILRRSGDAASVPFDQDSLGLALIHRNTSGALSKENFPMIVGKTVPDTDRRYWATVTLAPPPSKDAELPIQWTPSHTASPATEWLTFFGEN